MTAPALALPASIAALFDDALRDRLLELRRALHAHPELSHEEHDTSRRLIEALVALGVRDVKRCGATGVVARIPGRNPGGGAIAIRGDIDALPITEATGLPFASQTPGVMHACGHDVHATWAVGAAALLQRDPAERDVVVILQPAEERGDGALAMIEQGALDGVGMIFGGHVDRRFEVGRVVADAGPLPASADTFEIELTGRGAHAARPHEAADPIVGAAALVSALQTIVARRLNPATAGVVTVGTLHAGTAPNVIPDRATLGGTIRAIDAPSRTLMVDDVRRIAEGVAATHRLDARVTFERGTPAIVNPEGPIAIARDAVTSLLGESALVPLGTLNMAAEDFAYYLERIPGCFLRIGAREPGGEFVAAHSPKFVAAEEAIFVGAAVLASVVRRVPRETELRGVRRPGGR